MTSFHVHISIPGALAMELKDFKKSFNGVFLHDDGTPMTGIEAKMALLDELSRGHEIVPSQGCDNFDWKTGCLGHKKEVS